MNENPKLKIRTTYDNDDQMPLYRKQFFRGFTKNRSSFIMISQQMVS